MSNKSFVLTVVIILAAAMFASNFGSGVTGKPVILNEGSPSQTGTFDGSADPCESLSQRACGGECTVPLGEGTCTWKDSKNPNFAVCSCHVPVDTTKNCDCPIDCTGHCFVGGSDTCSCSKMVGELRLNCGAGKCI